MFIKTALSWLLSLEPSGHMRCCGSEVLTQSRAHAHESSLTDLHIACEPSASRDSGTDASQANAASAAGSAARRHGACSGAAPRQAEDELSAAVTREVRTTRVSCKVWDSVFSGLWWCFGGADQECAPAPRCRWECACRRTERRQFE